MQDHSLSSSVFRWVGDDDQLRRCPDEASWLWPSELRVEDAGLVDLDLDIGNLETLPMFVPAAFKPLEPVVVAQKENGGISGLLRSSDQGQRLVIGPGQH